MSSAYYLALINAMTAFRGTVTSVIGQLNSAKTKLDSATDKIAASYKKDELTADNYKCKNNAKDIGNLINELNGITIPGIDAKLAELRALYAAAKAREEAEAAAAAAAAAASRGRR